MSKNGGTVMSGLTAKEAALMQNEMGDYACNRDWTEHETALCDALTEIRQTGGITLRRYESLTETDRLYLEMEADPSPGGAIGK